jgi:hypothetical protein
LKARDSQSLPSNEILRRLQEALLRALLLGVPLPGSERPVRFPDLPFILRQPYVLLVDDNLAGPISIDEWPHPIRILPRETLMQEARTKGELTYLQFKLPVVREDAIELTLEARLAPHFRQGALGLSSIHAKFRNIAGEWQVAGDPVFSAA